MISTCTICGLPDTDDASSLATSLTSVTLTTTVMATTQGLIAWTLASHGNEGDDGTMENGMEVHDDEGVMIEEGNE